MPNVEPPHRSVWLPEDIWALFSGASYKETPYPEYTQVESTPELRAFLSRLVLLGINRPNVLALLEKDVRLIKDD